MRKGDHDQHSSHSGVVSLRQLLAGLSSQNDLSSSSSTRRLSSDGLSSLGRRRKDGPLLRPIPAPHLLHDHTSPLPSTALARPPGLNASSKLLRNKSAEEEEDQSFKQTASGITRGLPEADADIMDQLREKPQHPEVLLAAQMAAEKRRNKDATIRGMLSDAAKGESAKLDRELTLLDEGSAINSADVETLKPKAETTPFSGIWGIQIHKPQLGPIARNSLWHLSMNRLLNHDGGFSRLPQSGTALFTAFTVTEFTFLGVNIFTMSPMVFERLMPYHLHYTALSISWWSATYVALDVARYPGYQSGLRTACGLGLWGLGVGGRRCGVCRALGTVDCILQKEDKCFGTI